MREKNRLDTLRITNCVSFVLCFTFHTFYTHTAPLERKKTLPLFYRHIAPLERKKTLPLFYRHIAPLERKKTLPLFYRHIAPLERKKTLPLFYRHIAPLERKKTLPLFYRHIAPLERQQPSNGLISTMRHLCYPLNLPNSRFRQLSSAPAGRHVYSSAPLQRSGMFIVAIR